MMKLSEKSNPGELLSGFILLAFALYLASTLTGCSFGVEIQYHGRTGISNTTATGLIPVRKVVKDKEEY